MRPSVCTHDRVNVILDLVGNGLTLLDALTRVRVPRTTFWSWIVKGRELARNGVTSVDPRVYLVLHWPEAKAARKATLLGVVDTTINHGDAHLALKSLERLEKLEAVGAYRVWPKRKPEAEIVIPEPRPQPQPEPRPQQPAPASARVIIRQIEARERADISHQWGDDPADWDNE